MGIIEDGNTILADDILSCMRTTAEAGEAITIGKACYIKESDGKAYLSDKSSAPYFTGIAYAGVDAAADVTLVTKGKFVTTSLTDKEVYYLGSSGAISTTASAVRIGTADGTTDLYIDTNRYNQGGGVIHRKAYVDAGNDSVTTNGWADMDKTFTLSNMNGALILNVVFNADISTYNTTYNAQYNLKISGSETGPYYLRQIPFYEYPNGTWYYIPTVLDSEGNLFYIQNDNSMTSVGCTAALNIKCEDDDIVFMVRCKTGVSHAEARANIENVTITVTYVTGYVEDA